MRDSDEVTRAPALRRGFQVAERLVLQCALRGEYDVRPLFSGGAHGLDHFREGVIYLLKNSPWAPTKPNTRKPTRAPETTNLKPVSLTGRPLEAEQSWTTVINNNWEVEGVALSAG